MSTPKTVKLDEVRRITIAYSKDTYRGHPRLSGMFSFGGGVFLTLGGQG